MQDEIYRNTVTAVFAFGPQYLKFEINPRKKVKSSTLKDSSLSSVGETLKAFMQIEYL